MTEPEDEPHPHAERIEALITGLGMTPPPPPPAPPPPPPPPPSREALERRDMKVFVGDNSAKFMPVLDGMLDGRGANGWCWPGLFFPTAWFLYRKMYGWAGLACALAVILGNTHIFPPAMAWLGLAPSVVGAFGRRIYIGGARKTIASIRAEAADERTALEAIRAAGGVSTAGLVLGILFYLSVSILTAKTNGQFHFGPNAHVTSGVGE